MWPNSCSTTQAKQEDDEQRAVERGGGASPCPGAEGDPGEEQDEGDMYLDLGPAEAANGDGPAHRSASVCGAILAQAAPPRLPCRRVPDSTLLAWSSSIASRRSWPLSRSRKSGSALAASCPSPRKHIREQSCLSQSKFLQSKPGQANPSSAKLIQIKTLGFTWFYSSESGLINGLQRFQIRIFSSPLRLVAKPRLARRAFGSDYQHKVGRLLIFTSGESKNCVVSLSGFLFRPPLGQVARDQSLSSLKS